mmetsp:Transcript_7172/g.7269  ORF Transcript_7172/g.7269 Transcript_7172/m.7269 type:complete len:1025 (+) Transcript_7172:60-3134(+)
MDVLKDEEGQSFFSNVKNFLWRKRLSSVVPLKLDATFLQLKEIGYDENFIHFTSLAERLFKVPLAVVYLSDHEFQSKKKSTVCSNQGRKSDEDRETTPEEMGFFGSLPQGNTVSVINHKVPDHRLNLAGSSSIRFYAGVALCIGDKKIGTLFLVDRKIHKKFNVNDENVLLDLGIAISSTIKERVETDKKCSNDAAEVMVDMMHNLRTPLTALNMATLILLDNQEESELNKTRSISTKDTDENKVLLKSLDSAVGELKVVVESSLCLGQFTVDSNSSLTESDRDFSYCNILQTIDDARRTLCHLDRSDQLKWVIDEDQHFSQGAQICSPKSVYFVLLSTIQKLLCAWQTVTVHIHFKETRGQCERVLKQQRETKSKDWTNGLLGIDFQVSGPLEDKEWTSDFSDTGNDHNSNFYAVKLILNEIGGDIKMPLSHSRKERLKLVSAGDTGDIDTRVSQSYSTDSNEDSMEYNLKCWLPCGTLNVPSTPPRKEKTSSLDDNIRCKTGQTVGLDSNDCSVNSFDVMRNRSQTVPVEAVGTGEREDSMRNRSNTVPNKALIRKKTYRKQRNPTSTCSSEYDEKDDRSRSRNNSIVSPNALDNPLASKAISGNLPIKDNKSMKNKNVNFSNEGIVSITCEEGSNLIGSNEDTAKIREDMCPTVLGLCEDDYEISCLVNRALEGIPAPLILTQPPLTPPFSPEVMIRKGSTCNDRRLNYRRDSIYTKLQAALGTGSEIMRRRVSLPGKFEEGLAYTPLVEGPDLSTDPRIALESVFKLSKLKTIQSSADIKTVKPVKTVQSSADILSRALNAPSSEPEPSAVVPCPNLRILLVEDTVSIQKLMGRWLSNHDCDVTIADNGLIGLEKMKTQQFDICFMDFFMPIMQGEDTISEYRKWVLDAPLDPLRRHNRQMLIIGLSANASAISIKEAFKFGMHFFCPKPAENSVLCTIINVKKNSESLLDAIECIQNEIDTGDSIISGDSIIENKETFSKKILEKKVLSHRQVMIPSPRTLYNQPKTPAVKARPSMVPE